MKELQEIKKKDTKIESIKEGIMTGRVRIGKIENYRNKSRKEKDRKAERKRLEEKLQTLENRVSEKES